jgi:hypothetical protein
MPENERTKTQQLQGAKMPQPMKQTLTIHAPSAEDLEAMVDQLTSFFQDYKDSGSAPEQVFYDLGEPEPSDEEYE